MSLKHSIIHHIARPVPGGDIEVTLKSTENDTQGPIFSLFEQLKQSFQRSSQRQYGHFDQENSSNPLPGWLKDQAEGKSSFLSNSERIIGHLERAMESHQEAFSAHILIAQEMVMDQAQFYLFWINHTEASHIDSNLEVGINQFIDCNKMQYSLRLFLDEWLEYDSQKYLSIITHRGNKKLSDAFTDFSGFTQGLDLKEDTQEFLGIVDDYIGSVPEEQVQDYKNKIIDYCVEQDRHGEPVMVDDLSQQLNESSPTQFAQFVTEHQQSPKSEIYTDRNSLKRYVRYFGRDNQMSISFSADMYGQDIIYDPNTDTLTLKRIPKSLKRQLLNPSSAHSSKD